MPASPPDITVRLYEDALLELARAARAFAAAIAHAADAGDAAGDGAAAELAVCVIDECRQVLLPALVRAPGMLQVFANQE